MTHPNLPLCRGALLFIVTSATLGAQTPSVEERLSRLEAAISRLESRLGDTVSADELSPTLKEYSELTRQLGWNGKAPLTVVKPAGKEKSLALGGFMQALFESGEAPDARYTGINNRFLLRRVRLNASGSFAEDISFKVEADFGNNSISARTGAAGQLTDAFASWTKYPAASLRAGQFKTPFGYEQLLPDTKIYTIERSLPNDRLTLGRQVGAMVYGEVADKRLGYSVASYNGTGTNNGGNDNQKFLWVQRLGYTAYEGKVGDKKVKLSLGENYFTTKDRGTFTGRREGLGFDAQLGFGPGELQAEWLRSESSPATGSKVEAEGWAVLGAYNFTKQWQGVVRYETYDSNKATAATTTDLWTFGINYLLKGDDLKFSLNYISGEPPAPLPHGDRIIGRVQVVF
jgi:phosphate-selective porin